MLLHDNVNQKQMLQAQLSYLSRDYGRRQRLLDQHRKSFLVQQSLKQQHLRSIGVRHISFLPEAIAQAHIHVAKFTALSSAKKCNQVTPRVRSDSAGVVDIPGDGADGVGEVSIALKDGGPCGKRSRSALPTKPHREDGPDRFLTHDYHLRREKTHLHHSSRVTHSQCTLVSSGASHVQCSVRDPRFLSLQRSLADTDGPHEGFLLLSPSGRDVMRRYGDTPLYDYSFLRSMSEMYAGVDKTKFTMRRERDNDEHVEDDEPTREVKYGQDDEPAREVWVG